MADYSFVVNSTYNPFTLQEMLVPYQLYGEAFNKAEEQAIELQKNADEFSYLADTLEEGSKARALYEKFANDLRSYSDDLSANGLSMANRRGIATMRKRYSGEIGRLKKADEALQEERIRRLNLSSNDPTMLYATDNLSIDSFLDRKEPNRYNVSGQKLYERGVQIGASDSSRVWNDPKVQQVNEFYQNLYTTSGRDNRVLAEWRANIASIPELNSAVESTLKELGVTDNLTGVNYQRAKESIINGIINGSTYKKADSLQKDPNAITKLEQIQLNRDADKLALQAASAGMVKDAKGNWTYDYYQDPSIQQAVALQGLGLSSARDSGKGTTGDSSKASKSSSSKSDNLHRTISKQATIVNWHGNDPAKGIDNEVDFTISSYSPGEEERVHPGQKMNYDNLPAYAKRQVQKIVGNGAWDYYDYFFQPFKSGFWDDTEAQLEVVPRALTTDELEVNGGGLNYDQIGN